jgi:acyl-CoA synthetase (AMP-forming)/AMP-acid ligase II
MYLTQGLHRAVQRMPDATMTVFGERTRTFRQVADRVARLAGSLRGLGVGNGDRVALLGFNSDRYSECLLAVAWANAAVTPINVRWTVDEVVYCLADSQTAVLFIDGAFTAMLPAMRQGYPALRAVVYGGDGPAPDGTVHYEELIDAGQAIPDARRGGDQLAGLFYTGGTTAFPKGVMLSHHNLITSAIGTRAGGHAFGDGGRYLHAAPMFHLADLAAWTAELMIGGVHVIIPGFDPTAVMAAIQTHQVTDVVLVPTMIQMLVDHPAAADHDLSSLRSVVYGASPMTPGLLDRAIKALPSASFTQAYGMTELAPVATLLAPHDHQGARLRSAGQAAMHAEVRVVDAADVEVAPGMLGEIVVRGGHVMLGYWNRPDETAAALRGGWMHTGDAGYLDDDGYLYVVDRIKDVIKSGGENVYSVEVENAVASHPAVAGCAVIGIADALWGERVHAVVVRKAGAHVSADELREHVKGLIAGYKAPRTCQFVDALPVSSAGKILKRQLRAAHAQADSRPAP